MRRAIGLGLILLLAWSVSVWAGSRSVVVNGVLVAAHELALLDELNGEPVPDGRYWLDTTTGAWGYEGGPQEGVLGQEEAPVTATSPGAATGGGRYFEDEVGDWCIRNRVSC